LLISWYKNLFKKEEKKKDEPCHYEEFVKEQEKVLKRNDNGTSA